MSVLRGFWLLDTGSVSVLSKDKNYQIRALKTTSVYFKINFFSIFQIFSNQLVQDLGKSIKSVFKALLAKKQVTCLSADYWILIFRRKTALDDTFMQYSSSKTQKLKKIIKSTLSNRLIPNMPVSSVEKVTEYFLVQKKPQY